MKRSRATNIIRRTLPPTSISLHSKQPPPPPRAGSSGAIPVHGYRRDKGREYNLETFEGSNIHGRRPLAATPGVLVPPTTLPLVDGRRRSSCLAAASSATRTFRLCARTGYHGPESWMHNSTFDFACIFHRSDTGVVWCSAFTIIRSYCAKPTFFFFHFIVIAPSFSRLWAIVFLNLQWFTSFLGVACGTVRPIRRVLLWMRWWSWGEYRRVTKESLLWGKHFLLQIQ